MHKMSGGVGPISDINLLQEQLHEPEVTNTGLAKKPVSRHHGFSMFRQLNVLAVAIVLSASGMVSVEDFIFVVFSIAYMYFLSKVAFPANSHDPSPPVLGEKNALLSIYTLIGLVIGLVIPIVYIFEGIFEGDKEGIKAAVPHVFLLASQVFMEGMFSGNFSLPIQVFIPFFYNARRVLTIMEWVTNEVLYKVAVDHGGNSMRLYVGRALTVANMAFWSFNLFGFLLPFYLPKAFKLYYGKISKD